MSKKISSYSEYIEKYFPNSVLIAVPNDQKEEIEELIYDYLLKYDE
jgi:hypothetical protein